MRLGKRRARNPQGVHGDVLLVERRNEYLAEPGEEQPRYDEQDHGSCDESERASNCALQRWLVKHLHPSNETVLLFLNASRDEDGNHRGHEGQRENESRGKSDDDGQRHRLEHLAFDACEGQQRHVNENDDRLAKDGWLDHLLGGLDDRAEALGFGELASKRVLALGQVSQAVLRDDDGAIDDEAKIERAENSSGSR